MEEESSNPTIIDANMMIEDRMPNQEDECTCGSQACLQLHLSHELDTILNPKVIFQSPSQLDRIWPLLTNRRFSVPDFLSLLAEYRSDTHCGYAWPPNYVAFRCRTCSKALTTSICPDCFRAGNHEGHDYNMFKSRRGGACDCGYRILKEEGHCSRHGRNARSKRANEPIPEDLICVPRRSIPRLIHRLAIQLRRSHVDLTGETDFYLDFLIQMANSSAVIKSLMIDALISEEVYSSQVRELSHHTDSDTSRTVREGLKKLKREMKDLDDHKLPESWPTPRRTINAFSRSSQINTFMDELLFWAVTFQFPQKLDNFLMSFIMSDTYKRVFAKSFVNRYPQIANILVGSLAEPRRHYRDTFEQLYKRVLQISVQIYIDPDLTKLLCDEEDTLHVLIYCMRNVIETGSYSNPVLQDNPLGPKGSNVPKVVSCDSVVIRDRALNSFTEDLNSILEFEHEARRLVCDTDLLNTWLGMLIYFQTMSPYKRELNEHKPYDTGPHISVFTIEADFCTAPMWSILNHFKDESTTPLTRSLLQAIHEKLSVWFHKMGIGPLSLLDPYFMSFHIPLHRMLAATLRHMIYTQNYSDNQIFRFLKQRQKNLGIQYGYVPVTGTSININIEDFFSILSMHPLQALTLYHETRSSMWTRNGLMTINQAVNYVHCVHCPSTIDLDMFLLRYCADKLYPNPYFKTIMSRFHAWNWFSFKGSRPSEEIRRLYNFNILPEQIIQMVESSLVTMIQLITLGLYCDRNDREHIKQEVIALISVADRSYSYLTDMLPDRVGIEMINSDETFSALLDELTVYKPAQHGAGGNLQQGCYTLKPTVWVEEYNPIHVQYRFYQKRDYQLSLERFFQHARLTGKLNKRYHSSSLWPPLKIPDNIGNFGQIDVSKLLESHHLVGIVYSVLFKAIHGDVPDTIMAYTIHLLELSLRNYINKQKSPHKRDFDADHGNLTAYQGEFYYGKLKPSPALQTLPEGEARVIGRPLQPVDQNEKFDRSDDDAFPIVPKAVDLSFDLTWFPFLSVLENCLVHVEEVHCMTIREFIDTIIRKEKLEAGKVASQARDVEPNAQVLRGSAKPEEETVTITSETSTNPNEKELDDIEESSDEWNEDQDADDDDDDDDDDENEDDDFDGDDDDDERNDNNTTSDILNTGDETSINYSQDSQMTPQFGTMQSMTPAARLALGAAIASSRSEAQVHRQQRQLPLRRRIQSGRSFRKERLRHGESILTLLLRLHSKYSQRANSYQYEAERVRANCEPERKRIGDGVHFVTIALDLICAADPDRMRAKLAKLQSLMWEANAESTVEKAAYEGSVGADSMDTMTTTRGSPANTSEIGARLDSSSKNLELGQQQNQIQDAAERRRRRAKQFQSRLMAEFANKQRAFIENYDSLASGEPVQAHGGVATATASQCIAATAAAASTRMPMQSLSTPPSTVITPMLALANEQPINLSAKLMTSSASVAPPASSSAPQMSDCDKRPQDAKQQLTHVSATSGDDKTVSPGALAACLPRPGTSKNCSLPRKKRRRRRSANFECCICGGINDDLEVGDDEAMGRSGSPLNPLGQVVLLQSTSVFGHSHLRPASKRRLPCEDHELAALKEETYAKYLERRIDLLYEPFAESSWLDSINIGAEGGVHVQSCGHYLHIECHQSYIKSLDHEDRLRGRNDGDEFLCPVCRQLANSVLPILDGGDGDDDNDNGDDDDGGGGGGDDNDDDYGAPEGEEADRNDMASVGGDYLGGERSANKRQLAVNLDDHCAILGRLLANAGQAPPNQRQLKSSETFCKHLPKATAPQYRSMRSRTHIHSLFLFLTSIARTNLECELIVRSLCQKQNHQDEQRQQQQQPKSPSPHDQPQQQCHQQRPSTSNQNQLAAKRSCFRLLFHVLALNAQTLINDQWFTCDQIWAHLTRCADEKNRLSVKPKIEAEVPLLLRDPVAMLLQFLFAITSSSLCQRANFLCLVRILYNLTVIQSLALAVSYLGKASTSSSQCRASSSSSSSLSSLAGKPLDFAATLSGDTSGGVQEGGGENQTEGVWKKLETKSSSGRGQTRDKCHSIDAAASSNPQGMSLEGEAAFSSETTSLRQETSTNDYQNLELLLEMVQRELRPLLGPQSEEPLMEPAPRNCWQHLNALASSQSNTTVAAERLVQLACLPFLRAAALIQHHLYGTKFPRLHLDSGRGQDSADGGANAETNDTLTNGSLVNADFCSLARNLSLLADAGPQGSAQSASTLLTSSSSLSPTSPTWSALMQSLRWPRAAGADGHELVMSWSRELLHLYSLYPIAARTLLINRSLAWRRPALMRLPRAFDDIFMFYYRKKCSLCGQIPKDVAVCLVCGAPICFRVSCCKDRSRSRQVHSQHCGANTAVFLAVHTSSIVVIRGSRACVWGSVYLDAHDEEDNGLQRGKPLYLVPARFELLEHQWLTHSFDHTCGKRWIYLHENQ